MSVYDDPYKRIAELTERGQNLVDGIGMEREMRKDAEAQRDALAEALLGLDAPLAWIAERYPAAMEAMPREMFKSILAARAALAEAGLE